MKKFLLLMLALSVPAYAKYPRPRDTAYELNNSPVGQRVRLGTQLVDKKVQILRGLYDFSLQGGAQNAVIDLLDIDSKKAVLPPGAIVKNCIIQVDAALGSSGSPSVSFSTGRLLSDLKGSALHTVFNTNDGLVACDVTGTSTTWLKMPGNYTQEYTPGYTSEYTPTMRITGGSLTRGKLRIFLEYILSR